MSIINYLYNLIGGAKTTSIILPASIKLKKNYKNADGKINISLLEEYHHDILSNISEKITKEDGSIPDNLTLLIGASNSKIVDDLVLNDEVVLLKDSFDFFMEIDNFERIDPENFDPICIGFDFDILKTYFSGCFEKIVINIRKTHKIKDLNMIINNCIDLLKLGGELYIDGNNYQSMPRIFTSPNCQYILGGSASYDLKKNKSGKYNLNIGKADKISSRINYKYPDNLLEMQKKAIEFNSERNFTVELKNHAIDNYPLTFSPVNFRMSDFPYFKCKKITKINPIQLLDENKVLINEKYIINLDKHKSAPEEPTLDEFNKFRFVHKKSKAFD